MVESAVAIRLNVLRGSVRVSSSLSLFNVASWLRLNRTVSVRIAPVASTMETFVTSCEAEVLP